MEILYILAAVVLLPIVGAGLRWLRTRELPAACLQQAIGGLFGRSNSAADYLLGLLAVLGSGLAIGGLIAGADVLSVALLLEMGALATALPALLDTRTWVQLAGARRLQFTLSYNLAYVIAIVALIVVAGQLSLAAVTVWPNGALRIAVHLVALLAVIIVLPAKLEAHPFAVAADAEAIGGRNPAADAAALGRLAREGGLVIFVAALILPTPGTWWGQVLITAALATMLTLLVRFFSNSISVRLRPDQSFDFYRLYGLILTLLLIVGTLLS